MLGSKQGLKIHVQNLGCPFHYKCPINDLFLTFLMTLKLDGKCRQNETRRWGTALETVSCFYIVPKFYELWSTPQTA